MHNFHDTHNKFPRSGELTIATPIPAANAPPNHHTWLTFLLPYIEQDNLYKQTNIQAPAWGQAIVAAPRIKTLRCPSDGGYNDPAETWNIAITNYVGSEGYHWWSTAGLGAWPRFRFLGITAVCSPSPARLGWRISRTVCPTR